MGNKIDLEGNRVVSTEEGYNLAKELKISFIETSAKTGEFIEDAFRILALQMIKGHFATEEFKVFKRAPLPAPPKVEEPKVEEKELSIMPDDLNWIQQKRFKFWNSLIEKVKETKTFVSYLKEGLVFAYIIAPNWGGIELCFCHEDPAINKKRFNLLRSYAGEIQNLFTTVSWHISEELEWDYVETRDSQRILLRIKDFGLDDENHWDKVQYKMIDSMKGLIKVARTFIDALTAELD